MLDHTRTFFCSRQPRFFAKHREDPEAVRAIHFTMSKRAGRAEDIEGLRATGDMARRSDGGQFVTVVCKFYGREVNDLFGR